MGSRDLALPGRVRKHVRSNIVGYVALFFVFAGVASGAVHLPKNSVGAKQIRRNAVTGAKVKDRSLTGSDIASATLGLVPNATHAATADHATSADTATHATSADTATNAAHATNADQLGGFARSSFLSTQAAGWGGSTLAATVAASPDTLLTRYPLTLTDTCTDMGGGSYKVAILGASSENAVIAFSGSSTNLTADAAPVVLHSLTSSIENGRTAEYALMSEGGTSFTGVYGFAVHAGSQGGCVATATAAGQNGFG